MERTEKSIILMFAIWCLACVYVLQNVNVNIAENFVYETVIMLFVAFLFGYLLRYEMASHASGNSSITRNYSAKDDLKVIEGIGPAIEKILNSNNIHSYNDLVNADVENLKKILTNAGSLFQNHNPASWGEQATLLRDGKMVEFKKLTDELVAGVRVN